MNLNLDVHPSPHELHVFPQTVGTTEGFWRLGKDIHECSGRSRAPVARQLLCTGCGLGKGQVALVHAKHSLAPLLTEKRNVLAQFPSDPLPGLLWPRCLPDASQMPLRCLSDASRCFPDASRCFPKKNVWGLVLG